MIESYLEFFGGLCGRGISMLCWYTFVPHQSLAINTFISIYGKADHVYCVCHQLCGREIGSRVEKCAMRVWISLQSLIPSSPSLNVSIWIITSLTDAKNVNPLLEKYRSFLVFSWLESCKSFTNDALHSGITFKTGHFSDLDIARKASRASNLFHLFVGSIPPRPNQIPFLPHRLTA